MRKRLITVEPEQFIGEGGFARVYRISPRRVVKVFFYDDDNREALVKDEILGAKRYAYALPILGVVRVEGDVKGIGVIKKYVPYPVSEEEIAVLYKGKREPWDFSAHNYRKDYDGTIYMVDTQTPEAERI